MTATTRTPHATSVDHDTASLLDLIANDRIHATDRDIVTEAIRATAAAHAGAVDMNDVRARLHNQLGCIVHPPTIGATVNALRRTGALVEAGWTVTTGSTSGNNGKPQRAYEWTGGAL